MKILRKLFTFAMVTALVCSCTTGFAANVPKLKRIDDTTKQATEVANQLPSQASYPLHLTHSNGDGHWGDTIILEKDGTFTGVYIHINRYETGSNYPEGTQRYRDYNGRFDDIRQIDATTYSMKLASLTQSGQEGETIYTDGSRHVKYDISWLNAGDTFYFYLPQTPMSKVPKDVKEAWDVLYYNPNATTLGHYTLYDVDSDTAYVAN